MRGRGVILAVGLIVIVGSGLGRDEPVEGASCLQHGCVAVVHARGRIVLTFATSNPHLRRYQLCVQTRYDGGCRDIRRRSKSNPWRSRIVWDPRRDDLGSGIYTVRWLRWSDAHPIGRAHFFVPRSGPPCRFGGLSDFRIVSRSRAGVVFGSVDARGRWDYQDYVACLFKIDATMPLDAGFDSKSDFYVNHFVWNGTQLAWFDYGEEDFAFTEVNRFDLAHPDSGPWTAGPYSRPPPTQPGVYGQPGLIAAMKLRRDGALAWVGCPAGRERAVSGNVAPYYCASRTRRPEYQVWAARTAKSGDEVLLDSGRDVDPPSLRFCGKSVCWRNAGEDRSAHLH